MPVSVCDAGVAVETAPPPPASQASKSFFKMRPRGPLPLNKERSMPASLAWLRMEGEVITFVAPATESLAAITSAGPAVSLTWGSGEDSIVSDASSLAVGLESSLAKTINGEPTATMSPSSPATESTVPLTGAVSSTAALSVSIAQIGSSSLTWSPMLTIHSAISASTVPSPRSGSLNVYSLILPP